MASSFHPVSGGAAALVAGLALAACGSSSTSGPGASTPSVPTTSTGTPTASSPSVATTSATPTMSLTPTAPSTHTHNTGLCTTNIRVIPGQSQGAAGHLALVLIFNNVGHAPCRILGYPRVDLVTASGAIVAYATHTLSGMAGGTTAITSITLAAGASASAPVEGSDGRGARSPTAARTA